MAEPMDKVMGQMPRYCSLRGSEDRFYQNILTQNSRSFKSGGSGDYVDTKATSLSLTMHLNTACHPKQQNRLQSILLR